MLLVVSLALTTFFYTLTQTMSFSQDTEARIKAISLAREGIEAVTNIRNTNWLRFSSSRKNCWDVIDYNAACITNRGTKITNWTYVLNKWTDGLWKLALKNDNNDALYINNNWQYVSYGFFGSNPIPQVRCRNIATNTQWACKTPFYRTITISKNNPVSSKTEESMTITSKVSWKNTFGERKVELTSVLTNWKSHYDN